ncbi:hypothetical protein D3C85_1102240 [compost metagenome]
MSALIFPANLNSVVLKFSFCKSISFNAIFAFTAGYFPDKSALADNSKLALLSGILPLIATF